MVDDHMEHTRHRPGELDDLVHDESDVPAHRLAYQALDLAADRLSRLDRDGHIHVGGPVDQGQRLDWWNSGVFNALFFGGAIFLLSSLVRRLRMPNQLVDLPYLRQWNTQVLGVCLIFFSFFFNALFCSYHCISLFYNLFFHSAGCVP